MSSRLNHQHVRDIQVWAGAAGQPAGQGGGVAEDAWWRIQRTSSPPIQLEEHFTEHSQLWRISLIHKQRSQRPKPTHAYCHELLEAPHPLAI